MGSWQLSLNASTTLADADIAEEEDIGEASRKDYDLTLGLPGELKTGPFLPVINTAKLICVSSPEILDEVEEDDEEEEGLATPDFSNESYSQKGPFIGASYSWQFEKAGRVSFSVAYARP